MGKRSVKQDPLVDELESIDAGLAAGAAAPGAVVRLPPGMEIKSCNEPRDLQVAVPFLAGGAGYCQRHLDVALTEAQALALRGIMDGLDKHGARLANGRRVVSAPDAIRWLLEETQVLAAG